MENNSEKGSSSLEKLPTIIESRSAETEAAHDNNGVQMVQDARAD